MVEPLEEKEEPEDYTVKSEPEKESANDVNTNAESSAEISLDKFRKLKHNVISANLKASGFRVHNFQIVKTMPETSTAAQS